jgi:hypothetical protein
MAFLRFLGSWFLVAGAIALAHDVTVAQLKSTSLAFTQLGAHWSQLAAGSLVATQGAVERWTHPLVWDPGVTTVLKLPAFLALALIAGLLFYLGRRRRSIDVFSN